MDRQHPSDAVEQLVDRLPRAKLLRAAARLAPIVGARIAELIPTGDSQRIAHAIRKITDEQTDRALDSLEAAIREVEKKV